MLNTIEQSEHFPVSAKKLYGLYMNPKTHAAFTGGGAVTISPKPGSKFSAFNGMLSGSMLLTIPGKLIVQRWRGHHWKKTDLDSILIFKFIQDKKRGRIDLVHVNVPDHDLAGVSLGWQKYYWSPLRDYLNSKKK